jgi:subtilisin family serine protease
VASIAASLLLLSAADASPPPAAETLDASAREARDLVDPIRRGQAILAHFDAHDARALGVRDLDGPLPAAGGLVFESLTAPAALPGLERTGVPTAFLVRLGTPAARDARVLQAIGASPYTAPAFVDRLGGIAWPEAAVLMRFADHATEADEARILASLEGITRGVPHGVPHGVQRFEAIPGLVLVDLRVDDGHAVLAAVAALSADPCVAFAEPNMRFTGRSTELPNDPGFPFCWGHLNSGQGGGVIGFDMGTPDAWTLTTGSSAATVVVIDTGVQFAHPDLLVVTGRDFTTGAPNGIPGGEPMNACDNHGTAVAGCVSARLNNALGTIGSAPGSPSRSARCFVSTSACDGDWTATYAWTANALNWAFVAGHRITNNSNAFGLNSQSVATAYATTRAAGMIHFASAGNTGNTAISFPASLDSVIAVGAAGPYGTKTGFSAFGPKLAFLAPGEAIYSTDRTGADGYASGDYVFLNGTSFASPYAAGVASLIRSRNPALTPDEVLAILTETARDIGDPGFDTLTGWGLIDAAKATAAAFPGDLDGDGRVLASDLAVLLGAWGPCPPDDPCFADLDGDGSVTATDIALLLGSWG